MPKPGAWASTCSPVRDQVTATVRFLTGAPTSRDESLHDLRRLHAEGHGFAHALALEEFFAAQADRWSPAVHIRHLARSTRPLAQALALPRWAIRLRFGRATAPSRTFDALVHDYRAALAAGGQAPPAFVPRPATHTPSHDERVAILRSWDASVRQLERNATRWNERELDQLRLPHPLLGLLTVREMLLFTVYHTAHHLRLIESRRATHQS
jgi:hypothetical protein